MKYLSVCLVAIALAFCADVRSAQAQFTFDDFDFGCAAQGVIVATQHQCSTPDRIWACRLEKVAVGFAAYQQCATRTGVNSRLRLRDRFLIRRAARRSAR